MRSSTRSIAIFSVVIVFSLNFWLTPALNYMNFWANDGTSSDIYHLLGWMCNLAVRMIICMHDFHMKEINSWRLTCQNARRFDHKEVITWALLNAILKTETQHKSHRKRERERGRNKERERFIYIYSTLQKFGFIFTWSRNVFFDSKIQFPLRIFRWW